MFLGLSPLYQEELGRIRFFTLHQTLHTQTHTHTLSLSSTLIIESQQEGNNIYGVDGAKHPLLLHCNTLQHTTHHTTPATHLQHTCNSPATHLQHTATHCRTPQCTGLGERCSVAALQHTATHHTLQHTCNTLQHTAAHCRAKYLLMLIFWFIHICAGALEIVFVFVVFVCVRRQNTQTGDKHNLHHIWGGQDE